ncbi:MAG: hypothetical protein GX572_03935 [Clostridia bacterium]|nr:hypothetical protein [Clostridia bacterium]
MAKLFRCSLALLPVLLMTGLAQYFNEPEIIFPEMAALVIGAWVAVVQRWNAGKITMVVLLSAAAAGGVLLVQSGLPVYMQILLGFAFCGLLLILAQSTFLPIISACILPVFLQTHSWLYPLSVAASIIIIVSVQYLLEARGLRTRRVIVAQPGIYAQLKHWGLLLAVLALLAAIAVFVLKSLFYLAPPLIVIFAELAAPRSPARQKPLRIWLLTAAAAVIGAYGRLLLCETLGLSLVCCAGCVLALLLLIIECSKLYFPPAGAIGLLPLLIPASTLAVYPLQIMAGAAVLIGAALIIGGRGSSARAYPFWPKRRKSVI